MQTPRNTLQRAARAITCAFALATVLPLCGASTAFAEADPSAASPLGEVGPQGPSAGERQRERPNGRVGPHCQPTIEVSATQVLAGEAVTVSGRLICPDGTDPAGQTVSLYSHQKGGEPGFAVVAAATTEEDGSYSIPAGELSANTTFVVRSARGRSPHVRVRVTPQVSLVAPPDGSELQPAGRRAREGAPGAGLSTTVTFSGVVTPASPDELLVLQRERPTGSGHWRRIGTTRPDEAGTYSITHTFGRAGTATVRVVVRSRGRRSLAASAPISYVVAARNASRPVK